MTILLLALGAMVLAYFIALGIRAYMQGNTFSKTNKRSTKR